MDETLFNHLQDRIPDNYDWSQNYISGQAEKLTQLGKAYYELKTKTILENNNSMVELCDPIKHCPENCQGSSQKFLIYHHLYYHYRLELYWLKKIKRRPPCQFVFVEGKPGTGVGAGQVHGTGGEH